METKGAPLRVHVRRLAGLALLGLTFQASAHAYERLVRFDADERCAKRFDARYSRLRPHLPATGIVGYVGPRLSEDGCDAMFLAQLALAPVLVSHVDDEDHRRAARRTDLVVPAQLPLVIVDSSDDEAKNWLASHHAYAVVLDVGDGLFLAAQKR